VLLVTVRLNPVTELAIVTLAFGTAALLGSRITPATVPALRAWLKLAEFSNDMSANKQTSRSV